jgi:7SK snRNA methylphosphate capping enzyme
VILALSITKWIHLNGGDSALKLFFTKCFYSLKRGGALILEAQSWSSYTSAKKNSYTDEMKGHLEGIQMRPDGFQEFLIETVGFSGVRLLGMPEHDAPNFQRPVYLFTK